MSREELIEELKKLAEPALAKDPKDRTYRDRYYIWEYEKYTKDHLGYDEGEEVFIYDGTKLANNEIKDGFGKDFPEWFRECGKHFGRQVKTFTGKVYTLIGMSYTYMDYYYLLEDKEGKRVEESCVGKITYL